MISVGASPSRAETVLPSFALPIACEPGRDCWVTKYVDVDPGTGDTDYTCGSLTQDGHKGTDIGVRDMTVARDGVAVLAAADGVVFATRDGMTDINVARLTPEQREGLSKTACGNAVVLDHGDGWRTLYCHMMKGSVAVSKGDQVHAGDTLGRVGMSGMAEHPHLHFGVMKDGAVIDPFLGPEPVHGCGTPTRPLWTDAVLSALAYRPLVINGLGLADHRPTREDARDGLLADRAVSDTAPMLIAWADVLGLEPGDSLTVQALGPDGTPLIQHQETRDQETLQFFSFAGRRLTEARGHWTPGRYTLTVTLTRPHPGAASETVTRSMTFDIRAPSE